MGWGSLPEHLIKQELKSGQLKVLDLVDNNPNQELKFYLLKNKASLLGPVATLLWQSLKGLL